MKRRALVIDDDIDLAEVIGEFLKILGWQPDVCSDSLKGSQLAVSGDYEVVFCDKNMPKHDGLQIAREIRSGSPKTRVILCTGEIVDAELAAAASALGARVVGKPLDFDNLDKLLE